MQTLEPSPSMKRATWLAVILGLTLLFSALGVDNSTAQGSENLIWACRHNRTGMVVITDATAACPTNWTLMSWNIKGEQGPQGAPGIQGPQGGQGSAGPAGDSYWEKNGVATYYDKGSVGIGTSNPAAPLEVRTVQSSGPAIRFGDSHGFGQLIAGSNGVVIATSNGDFRLYISQSTGNVGIGTTNPGYKLDVAGPLQATNFPSSSDARLKTNVLQLTGVLEKLEQIRGVSFEWNELYESMGRATQHTELGVIAQEVEKVYPELVTTWGDKYYRAVDYGRFAAVFIEAIKELRAEKDDQISSLEAENTALQGQIADLEARLVALEQKIDDLTSHER